MRIAYADPPYLGCCGLYQHNHPDGWCWNDIETHRLLIERLSDEFDAWALSASVPSLWDILPMVPRDARLMPWVKPFASFKPGIHPAYAWEPVFIRGHRTRGRTELTVSDYHAARITLERGLTGVKPDSVVWWLLAALNAMADAV